MRVQFFALLAGAILLVASPALAERTDELVLWNGNAITGEVKSLQQGKLKFKTDISVDLSILPGITDWPRVRVNFNGSLKREIVTDFTVNLSIFDSYDSDPPGGETAANHDFGIILSVGWTF